MKANRLLCSSTRALAFLTVAATTTRLKQKETGVISWQHLLMFLSFGTAVLIYEVVWRLCSLTLIFGGTPLAALTLLVIFILFSENGFNSSRWVLEDEKEKA